MFRADNGAVGYWGRRWAPGQVAEVVAFVIRSFRISYEVELFYSCCKARIMLSVQRPSKALFRPNTNVLLQQGSAFECS